MSLWESFRKSGRFLRATTHTNRSVGVSLCRILFLISICGHNCLWGRRSPLSFQPSSSSFGAELVQRSFCTTKKMLGSSCCVLIISSFDHDAFTSVAATPTIRSSSGLQTGTRAGDTRGNLESVSALSCCFPGQCLISNSYSCKASIHRARRPLGSFSP